MYQWNGMEKIEGLTALDLFRQGKQVVSNKLDDRYIQENIEHSQDKKNNMAYWDEIDNIGQEALEKVAEMIGIKIVDWGDFDGIKEITESLVKVIEYRFKVKFPYVDENY